MDSFLDKIFFDNTIRAYLVAAGIILAVLIFRKVLSKWTAVLMSRLVASKNKVFNRTRFQNLVLDPIQLFLLVLAVIIALDGLNFPEALKVSIYKSSLHDVIESIARGVLIGSFIWLCNRMIIYTSELLHEKALQTPDRTDDQLILFFRDFLKVLVWIVGVLLILKYSLGLDRLFHYILRQTIHRWRPGKSGKRNGHSRKNWIAQYPHPNHRKNFYHRTK
jgi:MscS family membrane protein